MKCDNGHRPGAWEILNATIQIRKCVECGKVIETAKMPDPGGFRILSETEADFYSRKSRQG